MSEYDDSDGVPQPWTVKHTAYVTGLSSRFILRALHAGELRGRRINGRLYLTNRENVLEWVASLTRPVTTCHNSDHKAASQHLRSSTFGAGARQT